jgi:glycerol-3-phosphate dehydrogenase
VFAGLRPLAALDKETGSTKEISRDHKLVVSLSGLVTITGGKWTTYRHMAEETINRTIKAANLVPLPGVTKNLRIHGFTEKVSTTHLAIYGSDEEGIQGLITQYPDLSERLHQDFPYLQAEVVWAVQHEMAKTVEDVLARRLRILFLNAKAALAMAPKVAALMAAELNEDETWEEEQIKKFKQIASQYLPQSNRIESLTNE